MSANAVNHVPNYAERKARTLLYQNDRMPNDDKIGLARIPFDDGTTMDMQFYKQIEYKHNGVNYEVLLSTVDTKYHDAEENGRRDHTVYFFLQAPADTIFEKPEDSYKYAFFNIKNYGAENEEMSPVTVVGLFEPLDSMVNEHFAIFYDYGLYGVASKDF